MLKLLVLLQQLLLLLLLQLLLLDTTDVVDRTHLRVLHEHTGLLVVAVVEMVDVLAVGADSGWFLVRLSDVDKLISQTRSRASLAVRLQPTLRLHPTG